MFADLFERNLERLQEGLQDRYEAQSRAAALPFSSHDRLSMDNRRELEEATSRELASTLADAKRTIEDLRHAIDSKNPVSLDWIKKSALWRAFAPVHDEAVRCIGRAAELQRRLDAANAALGRTNAEVVAVRRALDDATAREVRRNNLAKRRPETVQIRCPQSTTLALRTQIDGLKRDLAERDSIIQDLRGRIEEWQAAGDEEPCFDHRARSW